MLLRDIRWCNESTHQLRYLASLTVTASKTDQTYIHYRKSLCHDSSLVQQSSRIRRLLCRALAGVVYFTTLLLLLLSKS